MGFRSGLLWLIFLMMPLLCTGQIIFDDYAKPLGVIHENYDPHVIGGGVAVLDYNNDGLEDIYLTQGRFEDQLFEQLPNGSFESVTGFSDVDWLKYSTMAVTAGDVNNDGWMDLFVSTSESNTNILLINHEGTFKDEAAAYGITDQVWSLSAIFHDVNRDGLLDIYVCNYVTYESAVVPYFAGNIAGIENSLYIQDSPGHFVESAAAYGVADAGPSMAAQFSDVDQDGDFDLIVSNDFGDVLGVESALYLYDLKTEKFEKSNSSSFNIHINGMGISSADYNRDGYFDYYLSNVNRNPFLVSDENGNYTNSGQDLGIDLVLESSWATLFEDFQNDGVLDLFVSNGAEFEENNRFPNGLQKSQNVLYQGNSDLTFTDITKVGLGLGESRSRAAVSEDFNRDGLMDIVINLSASIDDSGKNAKLLLNESQYQNGHFISVALKAENSNLNGIGSTVRVVTNSGRLIRETHGGGSYASSAPTFYHFGLGSSEVSSIEVTWPDGTNVTYDATTRDQNYILYDDGTFKSYEVVVHDRCGDGPVIVDGMAVEDYYFKETDKAIVHHHVNREVCLGATDQEHQYAIYPNPIQDQLHIDIPENQSPVDVFVYSIMGELYDQFQLHESTSVDVGSWASGVYMMTVYQHGRLLSTNRMIKN